MHGRVSDLFRQKVLVPTYQYTKGLFPSGEAALASLYSDPPEALKLKTTGPAFIAAKFAINAGVWPILLELHQLTLVGASLLAIAVVQPA
ncbi:hypothetical protein B0E42_21720 [Pseudomonas sp. A25(2017)]|nr:hypothetical protein B0E42_21720 [Pseudomonas sp. A25(2017)]